VIKPNQKNHRSEESYIKNSRNTYNS